nr:alginate lyase family protein [Enterococcus sp. MSG2901]
MEACSTPYSLKNAGWNKFPEEDPEWLFMLSRHGFMVDLAQCYALTKEQRYMEKWTMLLLDFITNCERDNPANENSWRPLDVGLRLTNWMKSLTYLPLSYMKNTKVEKMLHRSIQEHLVILENSYIDKYRLSNWGVLAIGGMAAIDLFLPDLVTEAQRAFIWKRLAEQLDLQFYDDGMHWEQSPLYQHEVIMTYVYLLQISEYLEQPLPIDLRGKLAQPIQTTYYLADNQEKLLPLNDSDHVDFHYVYAIYQNLGFLKKRKKDSNLAVLWTGSLYSDYPPVVTKLAPVFAGQDSGMMVYKDQAIYFTLFNGLHGSGHGHASIGSFTLQLDGQDIIVDSGRYTYVNSEQRIQLKELAAHNTLFVAKEPHTIIRDTWGYDKLPKPLFHNIRNIPEGFFAECGWSAKGNQGWMIFERRFLYLKKINSLIILDNFSGPENTEVTSSYNLSSKVTSQKMANQVHIKIKENQYKIHFSEGQAMQETAKSSEMYNQLTTHQRIENKVQCKETAHTWVTVISPTDVKISPVEVKQVGETKIVDQAIGLRLENQKETFDLFLLQEDIVSGNKLLVSEFNQFFYGQVVLIDQDERKQRIK